MHERPIPPGEQGREDNRSLEDQGHGGITGVYYHPSFSRRSYLTTGRRLADFPGALAPLLERAQVRLFECPSATDDLILLAHDAGLIPRVEADPF